MCVCQKMISIQTSLSISSLLYFCMYNPRSVDHHPSTCSLPIGLRCFLSSFKALRTCHRRFHALFRSNHFPDWRFMEYRRALFTLRESACCVALYSSVEEEMKITSRHICLMVRNKRALFILTLGPTDMKSLALCCTDKNILQRAYLHFGFWMLCLA